jgi:hypothetical protein
MWALGVNVMITIATRANFGRKKLRFSYKPNAVIPFFYLLKKYSMISIRSSNRNDSHPLITSIIFRV